MSVRGLDLSVGTGFVVVRGDSSYLVTNRHNLSGRRSDTNELLSKTGAVPDNVCIWHNADDKLGAWVAQNEPLYDSDGRPLWFEHPRHGRAVDVVALPLTQLYGVKLYPHVLEPSATPVAVHVTTELSVVGFPFGRSGAGLTAIWTRGTVATEFDFDVDDLPCFLIDARTRPGQSGSAVVFYRIGGLVPYVDGNASMSAGDVVQQFLGIYSGRINSDSDLGFVWRPSAIAQVIDGQQRPTEN